MFWIGFCAGTAVCMLVVIVAISAIGWSVGKERSKAADNQKAMMDYWKRSLENQENQVATLENISEYCEFLRRNQ